MALGLGLGLALGGSLLSGWLGKEASEDAANAQTQSSQAAIAEQRRQFNALMERSQPYNQAGVSALNSLLAMEGLPLVGIGGSAQPQRPTSNSLVDYTPEQMKTLPPILTGDYNLPTYKRRSLERLHGVGGSRFMGEGM